MAVNMHKKYTESLTREWTVVSGSKAGDLVIHIISGQVGVALTDRGDETGDANIPVVTGGTVPAGGVVRKPDGAVVAVGCSWRFDVVGSSYVDSVTGAG